MTKQEVRTGFKQWYGHLTNWMFPVSIIAIGWLANQQYQGFVRDIKQAKENTEILLENSIKVTAEHSALHAKIQSLDSLQDAKIRALEYANASMNDKMELCFYSLKLKPISRTNTFNN